MARKIYFNEYNVLLGKSTYLPLVSGVLHAHALLSPKIKKSCDFQPYIFHLDAPEDILKRYVDPFVAAFSMSMWNEQLSLRVAREVKEKYPDCTIIVGGAQVPHEPEEFFSQNPFVDIAVRGEGEEAFTEIIERLLDGREMNDVPSISWRQANGEFRHNLTERPFIRDLDVYPSPYTMGLFDGLVKDRDDLKFQAIIETNRGCPFLCTFCYWGKGGLSRKYRYHSLNRVYKEIDWMGTKGISYVFNADSNFGMHRRDAEIAEHLAKTKKRFGFPEKFRTCYGKNTDEKILQVGSFMHKHGLEKGITISYQSMSKEVQKNIKRDNIKIDAARKLQRKFGDRGIPIYTELILGLPGETINSWKDGVDEVLSSGFSNQLFIYACLVFPNTDLGDKQYQKEFGVVTQRIVAAEIHAKERPVSWQPEYEDIIIQTNSMSTREWRYLMVFSWVTMLFHSLKLGYFILGYLYDKFSLKHSEIISFFSGSDFKQKDFPIWSKQISLFYGKLDSFLKGGGRGVVLPDFGEIYWDEEEACFLLLSSDFDAFFDEIFMLAKKLLISRGKEFNEEELLQVFQYQKMRIPAPKGNSLKSYNFNFNLPEYFEKLFGPDPISLKPKPQELKTEPRDYGSDLKLYARENILWGRKSDLIMVKSKYSDVRKENM